MTRPRRHCTASGLRHWLLSFARQPLPAGPLHFPYLFGYAQAYVQAGATVYDEAAMNALLVEARTLVSPGPGGR